MSGAPAVVSLVRVDSTGRCPGQLAERLTMSAVDEILADIPMDQLAHSARESTRLRPRQATRQAIPALLGGMQANAEDPAGAASLAGALGDHSE